MPTYTYTASYTKSPSIFKNVLIRLEHALVYMGFIVGVILVFENIIQLISGNSTNALYLLVLSSVLWMGGYISRLYFTKEWRDMKLRYSVGQWIRVEFLYFLFSYTFTTLFVTIFIRYFPVLSLTTQLSDFSFTSNYLNAKFVVDMVFHSIFVLIFIVGLLSLSEYIYQTFFIKDKYFKGDTAGMKMARISLIGVLLGFSYLFFSLPFVADIGGTVYHIFYEFFTDNMTWLIDYMIAFPIFYYLFVSYKGSLLAEKFSSYKK
jgi:hypothetical protein